MGPAFVTVRRGDQEVRFSEIEWDFVRGWRGGSDHRLLLSLFSFANGSLPDEELPLVASLLDVGEAMLDSEVKSSSKSYDSRIEEVKRLKVPWRHIGDTVDRVKIGSRVVGDYDDPAGPRPAIWRHVATAATAVAKLRQLLAISGTISYRYAQPKSFETF